MYLSCLTHVNELPNVSTATSQYLCVFISHEKYVSIINIEFVISIMSTPLNSFHSQSEIIFTNEHAILRGLSSILYYLIYLKSMLIKS